MVAWLLGFISRQVTERERHRTIPAGWADGVLHGVTMPMALPTLLLGSDPIIYASSNTGRPYKIGYTAGVNGCGAVFFGALYRRFVRRPHRSGPEPAG